MKKRKRVRRRRPQVAVDLQLHKQIREEARRLKISEQDYLRMAVEVSEALRTTTAGFLPGLALDGGLIKSILANPLTLQMLRGLIGNMVGKFGGAKEEPAPKVQPGSPYGHVQPGYQDPLGPPPNWGMGPPVPERPAEPSGPGESGFTIEGLAKSLMEMMGKG